MGNMNSLDWALSSGIVLLGWFLAVHFKKQYNVKRRDFFAVSFFVAGLSILITAIYQVLRAMLYIVP